MASQLNTKLLKKNSKEWRNLDTGCGIFAHPAWKIATFYTVICVAKASHTLNKQTKTDFNFRSPFFNGEIFEKVWKTDTDRTVFANIAYFSLFSSTLASFACASSSCAFIASNFASSSACLFSSLSLFASLRFRVSTITYSMVFFIANTFESA